MEGCRAQEDAGVGEVVVGEIDSSAGRQLINCGADLGRSVHSLLSTMNWKQRPTESSPYFGTDDCGSAARNGHQTIPKQATDGEMTKSARKEESD